MNSSFEKNSRWDQIRNPLILLSGMILTYVPLISTRGWYLDDWSSVVWLALTNKTGRIWDNFVGIQTNRPGLGLLRALGIAIFHMGGVSAAQWMLFISWVVTAIVFYFFLLKVTKGNKNMALVGAGLFSIYPPLATHVTWYTLINYNIYLSLALLVFYTFVVGYEAVSRRVRIASWSMMAVLGILELLTAEYAIVIFPLFIIMWIVIDRTRSDKESRVSMKGRRIFRSLIWAIGIIGIVLALYFVWRLFILPHYGYDGKHFGNRLRIMHLYDYVSMGWQKLVSAFFAVPITLFPWPLALTCIFSVPLRALNNVFAVLGVGIMLYCFLLTYRLTFSKKKKWNAVLHDISDIKLFVIGFAILAGSMVFFPRYGFDPDYPIYGPEGRFFAFLSIGAIMMTLGFFHGFLYKYLHKPGTGPILKKISTGVLILLTIVSIGYQYYSQVGAAKLWNSTKHQWMQIAALCPDIRPGSIIFIRHPEINRPWWAKLTDINGSLAKLMYDEPTLELYRVPLRPESTIDIDRMEYFTSAGYQTLMNGFRSDSTYILLSYDWMNESVSFLPSTTVWRKDGLPVLIHNNYSRILPTAREKNTPMEYMHSLFTQ